MTTKDAVHRLYGVPHSLYTGVARSYLRTQGIAYQEVPPGHPDYSDRMLPLIQRRIIPVLETTEGDVIQDSLDIIDYFERRGVPYSAYPQGALQRVLAIIVQYYGAVAMTRHAMHYRWSYRDQQEGFLRDAFAAGTDEATADKIMSKMNSYLPRLGVTEESIPEIERSYEQLLDGLNAHFARHPYLFGGRPSVADYGLIGPLFAHLGRDPVPCQIMKLRAPKVFRWVERMTAPGLDTPEYPGYGSDFLPDDQVPETLLPVLQQIAGEIFPELTDKLACMDQLVARLQPADGDPVADKPQQRQVGIVETSFRGVPIQAGAEPYLIYVLRRADRFLAAQPASDQDRVHSFLQQHGLDQALVGGRDYSVDRRNHIEVWERG